jgi:hypothetical protein
VEVVVGEEAEAVEEAVVVVAEEAAVQAAVEVSLFWFCWIVVVGGLDLDADPCVEFNLHRAEDPLTPQPHLLWKVTDVY